MQRVAIIGLGIMGSGMAANWLAKGFAVSVYNRTRAKAEPLAAKGATIADTPRAAADGADFVFAMVSDDAASRSVWTGADGALAGLKRGAIAIESSTLSPGWVRELAKLAGEKGAAFLDAPVGGSKAAAADGKLIFFVGGDEATFAKARPVLEAVSARINHVGPSGAGATWKLINNMMAGSHLAILAEGLAVAAKAGIDHDVAIELIKVGPTASPIVLGKMPRMSSRAYDDPDFMLRLMQKDFAYAMKLAEGAGARLDAVAAAANVIGRAVDRGFGDKDFAAMREGAGG
jgi:3-hydroxyisobutyrate dehydrogenase